MTDTQFSFFPCTFLASKLFERNLFDCTFLSHFFMTNDLRCRVQHINSDYFGRFYSATRF